MADRKIEITFSAQDDYSAVLARFNAAIKSTSVTVDNAAVSYSQLKSGISSLKSAWLEVAAVVAASAWFINASKGALEAEIAFNKLRIQIVNLGADYEALAPSINAAIESTSKYAIVQDEDVAGVLQQLILTTGNLEDAQKSLNAVYDLAYMKGIDASEAAVIYGKAIGGNIAGLSRLFPELKNVDDMLGKHATTLDMAAYAQAFFNEKVSGSMEQMPEHERQVRTVKNTYEDFKDVIGAVGLGLADLTVKMLGFFKTGLMAEAGIPIEQLVVSIDDLGSSIKNIKGIWDALDSSDIAAASKKRSDALDVEKTKTEALSKADSARADSLKRVEDVISSVNLRIAEEQGNITDILTLRAQELVSLGATTDQVYRYITALQALYYIQAKVVDIEQKQQDAHVKTYAAAVTDMQSMLLSEYSGYFDELIEMQRKYGAAAVEDALKTTAGQAYVAEQGFGMMADMMQNLTVVAGEEGGAAFEAMKAFAIAEAIIQTARAAVGAYAALAPIPIVGPALGVAAAAAAIAAGAAQIAVISATEPDSGTTVSASGEGYTDYTGGSYESTAVPTDTSATTATAQTQSITVIINNPLAEGNWKKIVEDNIIPAINDATDRNVYLNVRAS
mgnify:CR=1 FL=1